MGTITNTPTQSRVPQQVKTIGRQALVFIFRFQSFFGLIIVFLLAIYYSPIRNGENLFLSQRNLSNVTRDVAETGILATGQILVILIAGIDLSVGSVVALTATTTALLLMRSQTIHIPLIGEALSCRTYPLKKRFYLRWGWVCSLAGATAGHRNDSASPPL